MVSASVEDTEMTITKEEVHTQVPRTSGMQGHVAEAPGHSGQQGQEGRAWPEPTGNRRN